MENMCIRQMKIEDYDRVYALWKTIRGFGIRSIDDSRAGVERFIRRNPSTSIVAEKDGQIVGSILCGHDGRIGCFSMYVWKKATESMGLERRWPLRRCGH